MGELIFNTLTGLFLIGIGFLAQKYPTLISGYNTLNEAERRKINIVPFALFMRKTMSIMGLSIIAIGLILYLTIGSEGFSAMGIVPVIFIGCGILLKKSKEFLLDPIHIKTQKWVIRISAVVTAIVVICLIDTGRPAGIEVKDNILHIRGAYSRQIPLNEITEVEITNELPNITLRVNGLSFWKYHKGYFRTKDSGRILLFLHSDQKPLLMIKSSTNPTIYINRSTEEEINQLYTALTKD